MRAALEEGFGQYVMGVADLLITTAAKRVTLPCFQPTGTCSYVRLAVLRLLYRL